MQPAGTGKVACPFFLSREDGKALLGRMYREGAKLVATGCLNRCIVEGIVQSEEKA